MAAGTPTSPAIAALAGRLRDGDPGAIERFWRGVQGSDAPLVECAAEEPPFGATLVTFLWRAMGPDERVGVITQLAPRLHGMGASRMCRLEGTDVWHATFRAPRNVRTTYWLSVASLDAGETSGGWGGDDAWIVDPKHWRRDPLNHRTTPEQPPASLLLLPGADAAPWSVARPGRPRGTFTPRKIRSAVLGNERNGWVYTPAGFDPAAGPYDFLLLFDGWAYANCVPTATILDNLIGSGLLPPTVVLLVGNPDAATRQRELGCHEPLADFVAGELVPWIRRDYAASPEPGRCTVGGSSRGGLAAAFVGLRRPDLFGNVLCQSGAFWFAPEGDPEPEWLARAFAAEPFRPLRFHLDVGLLEVGEEGGGVPTMLAVSRHLRNVLRAKGYEVHYQEFSGGHDYSCWEAVLPDALLALRGRDAAPSRL